MSGVPGSIGPRELAERLARGDSVCVLDVREHEELAIVRLAGATHVPLRELPGRLKELDASAEVVCLCHHGMRSAHAAAFLTSQGFERVLNLEGGIDAWALEVDPKLARY